MNISKNNKIKSGITINTQYEVSFQMNPTNIPPGYVNILHFTIGENRGRHGDRIPAVWFKYGHDLNSRPLFIVSDVNGNHNYGHVTAPVTIDKWTSVTIRQTLQNGRYWYEILINGKISHKVENKRPRIFNDVSVFASDEWHTAMEGRIKELTYGCPSLFNESGE